MRAATRGALVSAGLIMLSRIAGLARDVSVAGVFGQTIYTDSYAAALQVPDLLMFMIAGGVLSSSFIPVYTEYRREQGEAAAAELASVVFTLWMTIAIVSVLLLEVFSAPLVRWFGTPGVGLPGSDWRWADYHRVLTMTRIVLPAQIAFFGGGVLMGMQYVRREFVIPGLGPTVYNLGLIVGCFAGGWMLGPTGVQGLVWGGLIGAMLGNLALQLWAVSRYEPGLRLSFNWRHPGARRVLVMMLPVIFSLSMPLVDTQINRWFAIRYGAAGQATALDRAYRLMMLPVGVLGQGVATSFYATLANLADPSQRPLFKQTLIHGLRQLALGALPITAALVVLRVELVAMLFERGNFARADTLVVAGVLWLFALGIYAWCGEQLVGRAFYALQDTRTPPWTGSVVTVIFIGLNLLFMALFDGWRGAEARYLGLALATTLSAWLYFGVLLVLLRRKIGLLGGRELAVDLLKMLVATVLMALAMWGGRHSLLTLGWQHAWVVGGLGLALGTVVYVLAALGLGVIDVSALRGLMGQLRRRLVGRRSDS